jgi:hypothetical protein
MAFRPVAMALFERGLDKVRSMIGDAIKALGANPEQAKTGPDTWLVSKGSAAVVVRIMSADGKTAFLQVASPVMKLPSNPAIFEKLLRHNFEMGGLATFSVSPTNEVHLSTARSIDGLSSNEVAQLVAQVAHFSDLYDDHLLDEFGRQHKLHAGQAGKPS